MNLCYISTSGYLTDGLKDWEKTCLGGIPGRYPERAASRRSRGTAP